MTRIITTHDHATNKITASDGTNTLVLDYDDTQSKMDNHIDCAQSLVRKLNAATTTRKECGDWYCTGIDEFRMVFSKHEPHKVFTIAKI